MDTPKKRFFLFRWIDKLCAVGGAISSFLLGIIAIIIVYEIIMRKLFNAPTAWVGETSIYLWMVVGLLGAAAVLRDDLHFSITAFVDRLSAKNRRRMKLFTNFLGLIYTSIFVWKGYLFALTSYQLEDVSSGLMQMPLWIPGAMLPIGGLMLSLQFINKIAEEFSNRE